MAKAYGSFLLSLIIFGSNGVWAHYISLSSSDIVLWRLILGPITLLILFLLTRRKFTFWKYKYDVLQIAISGVSMSASWLLLFAAYNYSGIGISTVLHYVGPVIVIALSPLFFKERINATTIIGVIVVIIGVVIINFDSLSDAASFQGSMLSLISAVAFASATIFNKRATHIGGMENVILQMVFALIVTTVFVGFTEGLEMDITASDWVPLLFLGILNTGIALFLYFWPLRILPAQAFSVCGYLEAVSAVICGIIFLGQTMDPLAVCGSICVIGGAIFSEVFRQRRRKRKQLTG